MKKDNLNPVVRVALSGGLDPVEVRQLKWREYLRAVRDLTEHLGDLVPDLVTGAKTGEFTLKTEKVVEAISGTETLCAWLIQTSVVSQTPLPPEWVNDLSPVNAMAILKAICELNLTSEVAEAGKQLAGAARDFFGSKTQSPAQPTT